VHPAPQRRAFLGGITPPSSRTATETLPGEPPSTSDFCTRSKRADATGGSESANLRFETEFGCFEGRPHEMVTRHAAIERYSVLSPISPSCSSPKQEELIGETQDSPTRQGRGRVHTGSVEIIRRCRSGRHTAKVRISGNE